MELITERTMVWSVANRWRDVYTNHGYTPKTLQTQLALDNLDVEKATAEDVAEIIGNDTWCKVRCHECNTFVKEAVRLGEAYDYDSNNATICMSCLKKAIDLR